MSDKEKKLTQDQIDAYEEFAKKRHDKTHPASIFFGLLENADPRIQLMMARQAAVLLDAGSKMGKEIFESEKDPEKREMILQKLQQTAVRMQSSVNKPPPKDTE